AMRPLFDRLGIDAKPPAIRVGRSLALVLPPVLFALYWSVWGGFMTGSTLSIPDRSAPSSAAVWQSCAREDTHVGDYTVHACTTLIESGRVPGDELAAAYYNRAASHDVAGRRDQALADYTESIRLNPRDADVFNNRGLLYSRAGDATRARADFDTALRLDPG